MNSSSRDAGFRPPAPVERRLDAIQTALQMHGLDVDAGAADLAHKAVEEWVPQNGANLRNRVSSINKI